jgi:hypothetical protein
MNIKALIGTLFIHALLLIPQISCTQPVKPPPTLNQKSNESSEIIFLKEADTGTLVCDRYYIGVGLMSGNDGSVWDVAVEGPAYKAGVREGDIFENNMDHAPNTYPEGTEIVMKIRRGTVRSVLHVKVGKVCYA